MRISDWSSDVCSSDLRRGRGQGERSDFFVSRGATALRHHGRMRDAAGFHLVSSNRLEELTRHLAARVAEPVAEDAPLWQAPILIPQPTLRRWLQAWLAQNLGIAANMSFPTPSEFTWEQLRADRPELPETSPWDGARLRWRLYALLGDDAPREVADPLRRNRKSTRQNYSH